MANRREPSSRATKGELATVSRIDDQGRIHLQDGRALPEHYKQFTHGYVVTAHRSHGKSVDAVVISGDGMREELFYVAASRGRESITVVTSDREVLKETIAHSDIRKSASDLALKARSVRLNRMLHLCRNVIEATLVGRNSNVPSPKWLIHYSERLPLARHRDVVRIAQGLIQSPLGSFHRSQSSANANSSPPLTSKQYTALWFPCTRPLIESVSRNDAPARLQRIAERRVGSGGF